MPREIIYLDHASTSWPKPSAVASALAESVTAPSTTPGRGSHALAAHADSIIAGLRRSLAGVLGVADPRRVILTSGATESLNTAIFGVLAHRADRPRVLVGSAEHNAVRRPLEWLRARGVIELVEIPGDRCARIDADRLVGLIDDRTALVAVQHASNVTGVVHPIDEIARAVRERRSRGRPAPLVLVDASQTAGLLPLHADRRGLDLVAFSGHKALQGPAGVGALYLGPGAFTGEKLPDDEPVRPTRFGGTGIDSISPDMPADLPARFEPGTPNMPGLAAWAAVLRAWSPAQAAAVIARERDLVGRLERLIREASGGRVEVHSPDQTRERVGVLSLNIRGMRPDETSAVLEESFGIITRAGLHCAPGGHALMGTLPDGTVRISVGPGTTNEDIDAAAGAVAQLARAAV